MQTSLITQNPKRSVAVDSGLLMQLNPSSVLQHSHLAELITSLHQQTPFYLIYAQAVLVPGSG